MRKIKKRLSMRYIQLKQHPITHGNEIMGLFRYIDFQIRIRIFKSLTYEWIHNLKFNARLGDAGIVGNIYFGLYEFDESIFLLHFLREQDLFVDIGANVGHYSLLASGINKCKSIAIEPIPTTYKQLLKNIRLNNLNSRIETKNIGVSDKEEVLLFSNDRGTMDRIVDQNYINSVPVKVNIVDNIISTNFEAVSIKIDVEGYEKFVLGGMHNTLRSKNLKVLIIELNRFGENYNVKDEQLYEIILSYGFKPYDYNPIKRELSSLTHYNSHKFNTIFIRDLVFVSNRLKKGSVIKIKGKQY